MEISGLKWVSPISTKHIQETMVQVQDNAVYVPVTMVSSENTIWISAVDASNNTPTILVSSRKIKKIITSGCMDI
ncbi:unnamed protein product [Brachionus calyciflorus]|uniref:Uncharacterized protein n=1 Tax=Brachionus calyciflorus TaxID=104777 RepID=A0A813SCQ9_9BILA|nr:unnamed protein product [Brachionus calyciflorus]